MLSCSWLSGRGASAYVWVSVYSCVRAGGSVFACVSEGLVMMYIFLVVCHHELFVSSMRVCVCPGESVRVRGWE